MKSPKAPCYPGTMSDARDDGFAEVVFEERADRARCCWLENAIVGRENPMKYSNPVLPLPPVVRVERVGVRGDEVSRETWIADSRAIPQCHERYPVFGLKGRFRQPRAKPWVGGDNHDDALKGRFTVIQFAVESSFQDEWLFGGTYPGLRPGLTETALQAEEGNLQGVA